MGQKINPISLRLQQTNRHFDSCWYSDYYYSDLISRDLNLQTYFNSILNQLKKPSGRFFIQNFQKKLQIHLFICNPKESRFERSSFFRLPKMNLNTKKQKKSLKYYKNTHYRFKNTFLNQYSIQESKYTSSFLFLFGNLKKAKTKSRSNLSIKSQLIIRYTLLTFFLKASLNYSKNSSLFSILKYKINNLECFLKKSLLFLITKYVHSKLSMQSGKKQIKEKELFKKSNLMTNSLEEKTNISLELQSLLKRINKKSINSTNWIHRKTEKSLFNDSFFKNSKHLFLKKRINSLFVQQKKTNNEFALEKQLVFPAFEIATKNFFVLKNSPFREHLERVTSCFFQTKVNTFFYLIKNEKQSALFLADEIIYFLEKRILFRQIKNKIYKEIQKKKFPLIQGIRISCSGRGGGKSKKAQRAKKQTFQYGQTSLHVFSSKIDFAAKSARTSFGHIGIKVWICYKD